MMAQYYKDVKKVLFITLFLNIGVCMLKIIYGYAIGASSIIADGFHSLSDGSSNIVGLVGIYIAQRPVDKNHPYGHGKFESFTTLGISMLLIMVGLEVLRKAVMGILHQGMIQVTASSFFIMALTLVINIFVAVYEYRMGLKLGSDILISDSKHTRSDVLLTVSVIAGLVFVKLGYPVFDGIVGLFIAVMIFKSAYEIIRESAAVLCDEAVVYENEIKDIISGYDVVENYHNVRSRGSRNSIYVDLHIKVAENMSVKESHSLAHSIEHAIKDRIKGIKEVIVHIEPA